ncbi:TPA: hypothetical protein HA265_06300 [Candidatus Woesearchaeota archaeon]|nr:hypothetical protein [Candidatus Woesearchaeota archaeon]
MELDTVKRFFYWSAFFIFMMVLFMTFASTRVTFLFRTIIVLLLALLSSWFRFDNKYGALSVALTCAAAIVLGGIMANSMLQFWFFVVLFIAAFFGSCYVWEKNLLGV